MLFRSYFSNIHLKVREGNKNDENRKGGLGNEERRREGRSEPIGWIDVGASEEGGSDGFSNAFNVRNVFVEEMRRNFFGNWMSFLLINFVWEQIGSEEANCCHQADQFNSSEKNQN